METGKQCSIKFKRFAHLIVVSCEVHTDWHENVGDMDIHSSVAIFKGHKALQSVESLSELEWS